MFLAAAPLRCSGKILPVLLLDQCNQFGAEKGNCPSLTPWDEHQIFYEKKIIKNNNNNNKSLHPLLITGAGERQIRTEQK